MAKPMRILRPRPSSLAETRLFLVLAGLCSELVYLLYFVRRFSLLQYYRGDTDMARITGYAHASFWAFVILFTFLFAVTGLAWWLVHDLEDRLALWLVLGMGAVFALTMTFVYPVTAIDVYTYVDQSWIMVHYHQNPIFVSPASFPSDPLMRLADGWFTKGAPYGPLGIAIDAIPTRLTDGNLLANLIGLKLMFSAIALADAYLVFRILQRCESRYALGGALLVAWNPLVLFETGANGHNDCAMMFFALLALLSILHDELFLAPVLLAVSVLVKYATGLLLPLVLVYGLSRKQTWAERARYVVLVGAAVVAIVVLAYVPFWRGPSTLDRSLFENQIYIQSFGSVLADLYPGHMTLSQAALVGRFLFIPAYAFALWLSTRHFPDLLRASFLTTALFLALGVTNVKIWYALWPAMLAAAIPGVAERAAALSLGLGATISAALYGYVWVWLGLTNPTSFSTVNNAAYAATFLPAALALGVLWVRRRPPLPGEESRRIPPSVEARPG